MYEYLNSFEKKAIDPQTFDQKCSENRVIGLAGKNTTVLAGEHLGLKMNASIGLNSLETYHEERNKIVQIAGHSVRPDIMMDLSTVKSPAPLYELIIQEIGCPVGIIPYYTCFHPSYGIDKNELLDTIEQQAESGISFMTLHLTADLQMAELARSRQISVISRGGSLLLRDMRQNHRQENIILQHLDDIIKICKKYHVVISVGTTFRPSTLHDALDSVNMQELEKQKSLCKYLINSGVPVQMEGLGHIPLSKIPQYVSLLRKDSYIPFMPLGPIVSDRTAGQDHITSAVGASYMAALGGADIINAVTREEHTGGIPTVQSILEAIDTADTVIKIINDMRFLEYTEAPAKKYHNCMGIPSLDGCSRCGDECPFIWNQDY